MITFMLPVAVVSAADPDLQPNKTFSNSHIGAFPVPIQWDNNGDAAWENAFVNQYGTANNGLRLHSGKLFGQEFDIRFLYKKNKERLFPDDNNSFFNHDSYEIGSRIKGDWGNITLSFENRQIKHYHEKLPLIDQDTSWEKPFLSSTISTKRTNGYGRLDLAKGVGLNIELEYLTYNSTSLDDSSLNLPTLAYSANLNTQFGNFNTRTVYFHMDRNHDFSRYGDYSLHPFKEKGFRPLYILTGAQTDIFTEGGGEDSLLTQTRNARMDGIALIADYNASPRIKLRTAIGAANTDKTPLGHDDHYGWEANLGLGYKILNNLTYEVHLGYMATGDFFKKGDEDVEVEDITIITQHLTLKF